MSLRRIATLATVTAWPLFILALLFAWDVAAVHLPHLIGAVAVAVGAVAGLLRSIAGAALWLATGLGLIILPAIASPGPESHPQPGCRITALTFNAKLLRSGAIAPVAELLGRHPADVIFLQETRDATDLAAALLAQPALQGWHVVVPPDLRLMILSRFPLAAGTRRRGMLEAMAEVEGQRLRLFTAVGPKPFAAGEPERFARQLLAAVEDASGPVLVGLDLNAGPASAAARLLRTKLRDAAMAAGWSGSFDFTFPTPARRSGVAGAWLRIDQLLATPELRPEAVRVVPEHAGSTHHPVLGSFILAGSGRPGSPCGLG